MILYTFLHLHVLVFSSMTTYTLDVHLPPFTQGASSSETKFIKILIIIECKSSDVTTFELSS